MDFFIVGVIPVIGVVVIVIFMIFKFGMPDSESRNKRTPRIKLLNRSGVMMIDEYNSYIAGLPHYASGSDVGGFSGWIANDSGNTHDPNAMGIYNSTGKLLGFVPARELKSYRAWCDAEPLPCMGYIFIEDGQLRGRFKTYLPCSKEFLKDGFDNYRGWVKDHIGARYKPGPLVNFEFEE